MSDASLTPDRLELIEHRAWVRALARQLLSDENDVDDVEQETWTAALRTGPREPRAMRSWLGVVASRFALQRLRGRVRRERREQIVASVERGERSPADVLAEADAHGHVVQAVLALHEPYRATVLLRYFEGLAIAKVARKMECPVETVRTRLRRAHEQLRASLEREHRSSLALLLAPIAVEGNKGTPSPTDGAETSTPGAANSLTRASVMAAAAVALVAGGAWMLTRLGPDMDPPKGAVGHVLAEESQVAGDEARGAGRAAAPVEANDAPPPAAADPPKREPSAPPSDSAAWIAYDLADGKPLPEFELRVRTVVGESVVKTDRAGRIPIDRTKALDVAPAATEVWHFAKPTKGEIKDEPSLWFWREREVTGTARSADAEHPLNPGDVKFTWTLGRGMDHFAVKVDEPGRGVQWLSEHGFLRHNEGKASIRLASDGRLSGTATAVQGTLLTIEADGIAPAVCALVWPESGAATATFEMRSSFKIVGRVLDEAGEPVIDQAVSIDTSTVVASAEEAMRLMALHPRGGLTAGGRAGRFVVNLIGSARTSVRGVFSFNTMPFGETVVSVWKPGCLVCRTELGVIDKDVAAFEMRLVKSDVHVVIRDGGAPVASRGLMLQVADGRENGFPLATDADGRADAGWLQRGRWYRIVAGERNVCFRWDGQATLDLDQLPKEPPKDK